MATSSNYIIRSTSPRNAPEPTSSDDADAAEEQHEISTLPSKQLSTAQRKVRYGRSRSMSAISTTSSKSSTRSRVSVNIDGNTIDSQHQQYDLSMAMMIGMRFSVGKSSFEEKRKKKENQPFTLDDYMKIERFIFPYTTDLRDGTPRAEDSKLLKTFKFRAYAPHVFSKIRRLFGIEKDAFVDSLCGNSHFIEFMSNSASGEFFFYSQDGRYMIKTQTYAEIKFIRRILPDYYQYLVDNPDSFLTHYYGVYHVKIPHLGHNVPFVVMKSVFDTEKRIHTIWDLKGSTVGRRAKEGDTVLKDMDVVESGSKLSIGPQKKRMVMDQLRKDSAFLAELNIMDYSLLVGVHSREKNRMSTLTQGGEAENDHGGRSTEVENLPIELDQSSSHVKENEPVFPCCQSNSADSSEEKSQSPKYKENQPVFRRNSEESNHHNNNNNNNGRPAVRRGNRKSMRDVAMLLTSSSKLGRRMGDMDEGSACDSDESTPSSAATSPLCNFVYEEPQVSMDSEETRTSEHSMTDVVEYTEASHDQVEVLWVTKFKGITERDDCGIESWMVDTDSMQSKEIYFLGVIDILQRYTARKMAETFIKSTHHNAEEISCVDPKSYADRFVNFCADLME